MILIAGDSFSKTCHHLVWHDFIFGRNNKKKFNSALDGAGNYFIGDTINTLIKQNQKIIKKVIILWSQFYRLDLVVDCPINDLHGFVDGKCYQFSGGAPDGSKKWNQLFKPYIKEVGLDKVIENSYLQVKNTIKNLESYNIDFNFGFVYADPLVKKFETHDRFIPIIFNELVKHGSYQGEDGHHPSEQGHKLFAEKITKYIG